MAAEAALSRLYGGIHIRADNEVGLAMGRIIGALASVRALSDDLEDLVGREMLDRTEAQSLNASLAAAIAKVNQRNLKGATGELQAFISRINAVLKPADREPVITAAREIIAQFASAN